MGEMDEPMMEDLPAEGGDSAEAPAAEAAPA